jgi:hypothetical protein
MSYGGGHLGFPIGIKSIKFFSETTRTVETKLPRNDHWKVLYKFYAFYADWKSKMAANSLALIIFVVSEKKAFEHFPIGSNVNLCIAVAAILDFRSG